MVEVFSYDYPREVASVTGLLPHRRRTPLQEVLAFVAADRQVSRRLASS